VFLKRHPVAVSAPFGTQQHCSDNFEGIISCTEKGLYWNLLKRIHRLLLCLQQISAVALRV
jgi:hypothetical protein